MSDATTRHDRTSATRRDATGGDLIVSVADAGELLGISAGAVRKRLERGQLAGRKVGGQWQVVLTSVDATGHVTTNATDATRQGVRSGQDTTRPDATLPAVSGAARAQLEAIRDEWLAPLVAQIREQAETIGGLRAERDAVAGERDRLRTERDSDRLLADRLVDLLQAERDEARCRVAELEAAANVSLPPAGSNGHGLPYGVVRRVDPPQPGPDGGALLVLAGGGVARLLRLIGRVPGAVRGRE